MTINELPVGTRIYYKGDMANADGFGSISGHFSPTTVNISFDDGREFKAVFASQFENSRFQRFYLADNWKAQQEAAIIQLQRRHEEILTAKVKA